jgi:hypothetical protein
MVGCGIQMGWCVQVSELINGCALSKIEINPPIGADIGVGHADRRMYQGI